MIHKIDSEINRFDSEATALQNSNIPQPAPNPNSPFPPPLHLSPLPDGPDSQPKKPNPLSDLTNLGPTLSQSQAQSGGKWIRVLRPAHFSESYPLDSSTGKRKSHSPQTSSLPLKCRALDAAIADENSFLTAKAAPPSTMNWICWNMHGLGNRRTVRELEVVTRAQAPAAMFLA